MTDTPTARVAAERTWQADVVVVGARCAGAATARLLADDVATGAPVRPGALPGATPSPPTGSRAPACVQPTRWGLLDARLVAGRHRSRRLLRHPVSRSPPHRQGPARRRLPARARRSRSTRPPAGRRRPLRCPDLETGASVDDVLTDATGGRRAARDDPGGTSGCTLATSSRPTGCAPRSPVLGAPPTLRRQRRARRCTPTSPATGSGIEYHVGHDALAGIFPTHGGEACVWLFTPEDVARRHQRRRPGDEGRRPAARRGHARLRRPGASTRPAPRRCAAAADAQLRAAGGRRRMVARR